MMPADVAAFARYRISPQLLEAAGVKRVTDAEARQLLHLQPLPPERKLDGILFPYSWPQTGAPVYYRVRRDHPDVGKDNKPEAKYLCSNGGSRRSLYYPPGAKDLLRDESVPIMLVEAEKSALALTEWATRTGRKLLPIAMGGCWGWRGVVATTTEGAEVKAALPDLAYCRGRKVFILLDANVATNPQVANARAELALCLDRFIGAASVKYLTLPQLPGVNGPDDLIAECGDDALTRIFDGGTDHGCSPGTTSMASFKPQTLASFVTKALPPKEPLIEGVLYRRDRISLTGRRRNGKTTLLSNIAIASTEGHSEYLGYRIPQPLRVVSFYLEDDARELQDKLCRMLKGSPASERLHLYTREDMVRAGIRIDAQDAQFREFVKGACDACKPDLIMFDNLGQLIGADFNNAQRVQALMVLTFELEAAYNAATLIAAHPRKLGKQDSRQERITLRSNPDAFFEECMGSSHFINTTGSLWGIERDSNTGRSTLVLGAQRLTGQHSFTTIEKDDDDWLRVVDDAALAFETVVNTGTRKQAWALLPALQPFSYTEAREAVRPAMKSDGSFTPWWKELKRIGLLLEQPDGRFVKRDAPEIIV